MSIWLTEEEIRALTGYKQRKRQKMALAELGAAFRSRPSDGFPLVPRDQFQAQDRPKGRREPDWQAVGMQ